MSLPFSSSSSSSTAAAAVAPPLAGAGGISSRRPRGPPSLFPFHPNHHHLLSLSLSFSPRSLANPNRHLSPSSSDLSGCGGGGGDLAGLSAREQTLLLKRQRHWRDALEMFDRLRRLPSYSPNPIHYNVVLRAVSRARRWHELRLLWLRMAADAAAPTNTTYATLADAFAKAGHVQLSLLWLRHMKSRAVAPDEVTMNTFVRILKDSGRFGDAEKLFKNWCAGSFEVDFLGLDHAKLDVSGPTEFLLAELFRTGTRPPVSAVAAAAAAEGVPRKPRLAATYNTLIDLYGKAGRLKDASDAFAAMLHSGVAPDAFTFNTMINICGVQGNLAEGEALFGKMAERRVLPDTKTFNVMMTMFASVGDLEGVLKYYGKIGEAGLCPDTVSYRIVLQALCGRKMVQEAQDVIEMGILKSGAGVDEQLLPVVMKMYIDVGLLDEANVFFEKHCRGGGVSSKNYAAIIDAYAEKGLWEEAEHVFYAEREVGQKKDIVEYNVMVKAYGLANQFDRASSLFDTMRRSGIRPDECTYNSLIQMFSVGGFPQRAREFLERMKDAGFKPKFETYSAVIASCSRNSWVSEAIDTYNEVKATGVKPNEVVFGSLIDMFAEAGNLEEVLHYCNLMEESGISPNQIVLTSLIKAYSKRSCWKEAQDLYRRMKSMEGGPDIMASNCMINLYANLGMVAKAKVIFDELRQNNQADDVSYATMMYLYKSMGMLNEAIGIASEFQKSGLLSDCASYNAVMASYATNGKLRYCAELFQQMMQDKIAPDASTFKTIFTILKKGGTSPEEVSQLELAYSDGRNSAKQAIIASLFSMVDMHTSAIISCEQFLKPEAAIGSCEYNVAIKVYAVSGDVDKALNLFMKMQDKGLEPDLVTYLHLASCYGKAGMVEGLRRIYSLLKYEDVEPSESLYKALRDAYREAGKHDLAALVDQEMRHSVNAEMIDDDSETEYDDSEPEDD